MSATPETIENLRSRLTFQTADAAGRTAMLAGDIFPGAARKQMIRVDLSDGRTLEGKFTSYSPAIEMWTPSAGIVKLSLLDLPEELRHCFERELEARYVRILEAATDSVNRCRDHTTAYIEASEESYKHLANRVRDLEEVFPRQEADLKRLIAENTALQLENAELRSELRLLRT
jgi:hypothetical protein